MVPLNLKTEPESEIPEIPARPARTDGRDITVAVCTLTPQELLRLQGFACFRVRGLGRKARGRSADDLLQEAITATIAGDRVWSEGISMYQHLLGAMRSISSRWRAKKDVDAYLESELGTPGEEHPDPFGQSAASQSPERILEGKEELERVQGLFARDAAAMKVLELVALGYTGSEIQTSLHLTGTEHGTIMKRIQRTLDVHYGA